MAEQVGMGSIVNSLTAPTDPDELISWADNKRKMGRSAMAEYQMKLNLAFMLGYHWVTWDPRQRQFVQPRIDTTDPNAPVRITSNKIKSNAERRVAKITAKAPEPQCRPVSDSDEDTAAAKVGTRVLGSELNRLEWDTWLPEFMFKPETYGYAYAFVHWNPKEGNKVGKRSDGTGDLWEGQIGLEQVPAYELSVDPAALRMRNARWAVRSTNMTREEAWERWGVVLEGGAHRSIAQQVIALGNAALTESVQSEWVEVHQLWLKPGKAAPKGLVFTWSQQTVIEKKDFPYEHGRLPFVQCNVLPAIASREGMTWVTDSIPLQVDYNDAISREATIRRQLVPKWIGANGQIDPLRVTNRVEVMTYNPGIAATPPHLEMPNAGWAAQFEEGLNRDQQDMQDRAGINDASAGHAASTAPAASIMALQDADEKGSMRLTANEMSRFIADVGWQILMLARQYWAEDRTVRIWSDENILEAYRYIGSDIAEQLDVHVSTESAMPQSKAAQAQLIFELQQRFPNLIQPQDVIRLLNVPGVDFLTRSVDADTKKQYREIGKLLNGDMPPVAPFDNHQIHLKVLNDFRKSADYENADDDFRVRVDAHAAVHEMLILRQLGIAVPTPQPTMDNNALQQAATVSAGPAGRQSDMPSIEPGAEYNNPYSTVPTDMSENGLAAKGGIGQGANQPGRVPGIPVDNQIASMGN